MHVTEITIGSGLLIALMGMVLVLVVLLLLTGVFALISRGTQVFTPKETRVSASDSYGELRLHNVQEQEAAMIMAIVAHELQVPLNTLRFCEIREVYQGNGDG